MSRSSQIKVVKSNGEQVLYSREKLQNTISLAGADDLKSEQIADYVEQNLYDGIPTSKIYQLAYSLLRKKRSHRAAGRYRLKKAIFDLGPSGYPFEIFIGKLFESFGFSVKVGQIMQGKCVQHEVDVVASRDKTLTIVEIKFRGNFRGKANVQVPLYIHSRFNDIKAKLIENERYRDYKIEGYVVTNTRFTLDAINYAECTGLGLISWDYPSNASLKYYIDRSGLHPLTSLHTLRKTDKKMLLDNGIVLCRELESHQDLMLENGLNKQRVSRVLSEASMLIKS